MKRIALIAAGVLLALIIVVIVVLATSSNDIAREAIERSMSYVLETEVTVEKVQIKPFGGRVIIKGLRIANPADYGDNAAMALDRAEAEVDLKSFTGDQPVIHLIGIDGLKVSLEQRMTESNLGHLIRSSSRFGSEEETPMETEEAPEEVGKPMLIKLVEINGTKVALSSKTLNGTEVSIPIPDFEIKDIGQEKDTPPIAEGMRRLLTGILVACMDNLTEGVPGQVKAAMGGTVESALGAVGESVDGLKDSGKEVDGAVLDAGKGVTDGVRKGLGGLLKGDK